jgi:hypothetical protein
MGTFLKLKAEASGYPKWVQCPKDVHRYVSGFNKSEVDQLDKEAIGPNLDKRGLVKLCLNSMWGKLNERNDRARTKMISEPQELYRFLVTPGIEVADLMFASDDAVCASWRFITEENVPNVRCTNEAIGAFITAGARILLYRHLERLHQRALYWDTDSFVYIQMNDDPALVDTGDCLGL